MLLPNLEARLVDDDGVDVRVGQGERGELWIRGPSVMKVCIVYSYLLYSYKQ